MKWRIGDHVTGLYQRCIKVVNFTLNGQYQGTLRGDNWRVLSDEGRLRKLMSCWCYGNLS